MLEGLGFTGPWLEWLGPIGGIVLVDLVLSGDNALVIGAAASSLPRKQRLLAIGIGGGGAIVLRIGFAILATLLLQLPLLQAIGGAVLLYIAIKLLLDKGERQDASKEAEDELVKKAGRKRNGLLAALLTILIADVTMSLDNVLAVGALAHGNLPILALGLLLSVALLLLGSALVSELIARLPWLMDVASLVLAWTAARMILDDIRLGPLLDHFPWTEIAIPAAALAFVLIADLLIWRRDRRHQQANAKG